MSFSDIHTFPFMHNASRVKILSQQKKAFGRTNLSQPFQFMVGLDWCALHENRVIAYAVISPPERILSALGIGQNIHFVNDGREMKNI